MNTLQICNHCFMLPQSTDEVTSSSESATATIWDPSTDVGQNPCKTVSTDNVVINSSYKAKLEISDKSSESPDETSKSIAPHNTDKLGNFTSESVLVLCEDPDRADEYLLTITDVKTTDMKQQEQKRIYTKRKQKEQGVRSIYEKKKRKTRKTEQSNEDNRENLINFLGARGPTTLTSGSSQNAGNLLGSKSAQITLPTKKDATCDSRFDILSEYSALQNTLADLNKKLQKFRNHLASSSDVACPTSAPQFTQSSSMACTSCNATPSLKNIFHVLSDLQKILTHLIPIVPAAESLIKVSTNSNKIILVVDTNAIIHHLETIKALVKIDLEGFKIVVFISWTVIQELDYQKKNGKTAESQSGASNGIIYIDSHREHPNIMLQTLIQFKDWRRKFLSRKNDNRILEAALGLKSEVLVLFMKLSPRRQPLVKNAIFGELLAACMAVIAEIGM